MTQNTLGKVPLVVIDKSNLVRQQGNKIQRVIDIIFCRCGFPVHREDGIDMVGKHSGPWPCESPNFVPRFSAHRPKFQRRIHKRSQGMFSSFDHHSIFLERKIKEVRTKLLVIPVKQNSMGSDHDKRRNHGGNHTRLRCELSNDGLDGIGIWTLNNETLDRFQMKI